MEPTVESNIKHKYMKFDNIDKVRYLQVDAGVRYYEDAKVDGHDDVDLNKNPREFPRMPCVVQIKEKATGCINSDHLRWRPLIDIKEGIIVNWEKGHCADALYKVCDDGTYSLLDENLNLLYEVDSCVPAILSIGDDGYGDYIGMIIDSEGKITDWKCTNDDLIKLIKSGFDYEDDDDE